MLRSTARLGKSLLRNPPCSFAIQLNTAPEVAPAPMQFTGMDPPAVNVDPPLVELAVTKLSSLPLVTESSNFSAATYTVPVLPTTTCDPVKKVSPSQASKTLTGALQVTPPLLDLTTSIPILIKGPHAP